MSRGNTKRGTVFGFVFPWLIASAARPATPAEATRWCRCVRSGSRSPCGPVVWNSLCLGVSVAIFYRGHDRSV